MKRKVMAVAGLAAGLLWAAGQTAAVQAAPAPGGSNAGWLDPGPHLRHACAAPTPGQSACQAIGRTDVHGGDGVHPDIAPSGMGPSDIQSAYDLPEGAGDGVTVAIVDAYDNPNAESDLATYRTQYGLPACTTSNECFTKINQNGGSTPPQGDTGWGAEIALDLDAVSAACPACHILLVEADSNQNSDLYAAVDQARAQGATFISNSWSSGESSGETGADSHWKHPDTVIAFATGDNGFGGGTQYPASSQYTVAVGGTSLQQANNERGWTESAWDGAGSGCSQYEDQPSWQQDVGTGCSGKSNSDISADADPNTGLAIYDTYGQSGWLQYGGTSLATPLVTAMWAEAGAPTSGDYPASYPYQHSDQLNDVTDGTNGSCGGQAVCTAGSGWDGPTGMGTPNGLGALESSTTP